MFVFIEPSPRLRRWLVGVGAVTCVLVLAGKYVRFSDYRSRLSRHDVSWHGLRLQVDSGYVFDVRVHKLMILRLPPDTTRNLMWLEAVDQKGELAFKRRKAWCVHHPESCKSQQDALHGGTSCVEFTTRRDSLRRGAFVSLCELGGPDIQARYIGDAGESPDYVVFRKMLHRRRPDSVGAKTSP
jgi:hypothetical protein